MISCLRSDKLFVLSCSLAARLITRASECLLRDLHTITNITQSVTSEISKYDDKTSCKCYTILILSCSKVNACSTSSNLLLFKNIVNGKVKEFDGGRTGECCTIEETLQFHFIIRNDVSSVVLIQAET